MFTASCATPATIMEKTGWRSIIRRAIGRCPEKRLRPFIACRSRQVRHQAFERAATSGQTTPAAWHTRPSPLCVNGVLENSYASAGANRDRHGHSGVAHHGCRRQGVRHCKVARLRISLSHQAGWSASEHQAGLEPGSAHADLPVTGKWPRLAGMSATRALTATRRGMGAGTHRSGALRNALLRPQGGTFRAHGPGFGGGDIEAASVKRRVRLYFQSTEHCNGLYSRF